MRESQKTLHSKSQATVVKLARKTPPMKLRQAQKNVHDGVAGKRKRLSAINIFLCTGERLSPPLGATSRVSASSYLLVLGTKRVRPFSYLQCRMLQNAAPKEIFEFLKMERPLTDSPAAAETEMSVLVHAGDFENTIAEPPNGLKTTARRYPEETRVLRHTIEHPF